MKLRPRAEVICFKGTKVLADLRPYVTFPGGGIDPNESPIQAAKREAMEEADRTVITCTVAHPPSVQLWPDSYNMKGSKKYDGGFTYWLTGSTGDLPDHGAGERHKDYQPGFMWYPLSHVITKLKADIHGDWADDVRVRLAICEAHLALHQPVKTAAPSFADAIAAG